jgi:hypothetical protein
VPGRRLLLLLLLLQRRLLHQLLLLQLLDQPNRVLHLLLPVIPACSRQCSA